ncbi:MAG: class I SAM-dependent methyltransferase [Pyrinomonadaceae bacterium]
MDSDYDKKRERTRQLAAEFNERGDPLGWFDALYKESGGDVEKIPWADMAPNRFFRAWAESTGLKDDGRTALVIGCGLGDDAKYLHDLGFQVTAFDISPTAIEWAKRVYGDTDIRFEVADLFDPPTSWTIGKTPVATAPGSEKSGFDFVLEIYTIQPLPLEMRERAIDAVASFVAPGGTLVVVTRAREDDEEVDVVPWPLSRKDLSRFGENRLEEVSFQDLWDDEDEQRRFIVEYRRAT